MSANGSRPLAGKVAIVTGASKRLGRCYAMALARAGAQVVALARTLGDDPTRMGSLVEVEASAKAEGLNVAAHQCDLADEAQVREAIAFTIREFGGVDAIVNNAVLFANRIETRDIPRENWDIAFAVNVRAPYVLTDLARPSMEARGGGSIINITSLAAGSAGAAGKGGGAHRGLLLYGLTKAALNRQSTWFAAELASSNIAVNAISPGDVSVYMRLANGIGADVNNREVVSGEQLDEAFWGDPVVWLAGARPADVTGEILHTYTFGETWGPRFEQPPERSPILQQILGRDNLKAQA